MLPRGEFHWCYIWSRVSVRKKGSCHSNVDVIWFNTCVRHNNLICWIFLSHFTHSHVSSAFFVSLTLSLLLRIFWVNKFLHISLDVAIKAADDDNGVYHREFSEGSLTWWQVSAAAVTTSRGTFGFNSHIFCFGKIMSTAITICWRYCSILHRKFLELNLNNICVLDTILERGWLGENLSEIYFSKERKLTISFYCRKHLFHPP
jgi:hypothetical protein